MNNKKKIGWIGRETFVSIYLFLHFYVELYHNYQIYLDFMHTSHTILLSPFGYPYMYLKVLIEWQTV